jgi:hypothetical protein
MGRQRLYRPWFDEAGELDTDADMAHAWTRCQSWTPAQSTPPAEAKKLLRQHKRFVRDIKRWKGDEAALYAEQVLYFRRESDASSGDDAGPKKRQRLCDSEHDSDDIHASSNTIYANCSTWDDVEALRLQVRRDMKVGGWHWRDRDNNTDEHRASAVLAAIRALRKSKPDDGVDRATWYVQQRRKNGYTQAVSSTPPTPPRPHDPHSTHGAFLGLLRHHKYAAFAEEYQVTKVQVGGSHINGVPIIIHRLYVQFGTFKSRWSGNAKLDPKQELELGRPEPDNSRAGFAQRAWDEFRSTRKQWDKFQK